MLKWFPVLFLFLISILFSCKKNDSPVGINILPQGDIIGASYTELYPEVSFSHYNATGKDFWINTTRISNSNVLGSIKDHVFGITHASIYASFETNPPLGLYDFSHNAALDSAVLTLVYNPNTALSLEGDTSDVLKLDLFTVSQPLLIDSTYYSSGHLYYDNTQIPYSSYNVAYGDGKLFHPAVHQYLQDKDATVARVPQLNIRLKQDFAESIFNSNLNNNTSFQNAFRGLYITCRNTALSPSDNEYGSIFYVYLDQSYGTNITLYYHNDNGAQSPIVLPCGSNSTRFSHFTHDYSNAAQALNSQLTSGDTSETGNMNANIFVQGLSGVKTILKFPQLENLADSHIVINKAELVLKPDQSNTDFYNQTLHPLPGKIYLEADTVNNNIPLIENPYTFGGYYEPANNNYLFEIPHTVAQIMNHRTFSTKFYVSVFNTGLFPQRLVLGGKANSAYPIKLRLWYTRLYGKSK